MFGLFKNTKPKLTITPEDKEWIETNLIWLGETFGFERVKLTPFYLPTTDYFPYTNLKDEEQFEKLFCQLCDIVEVKRDEILVAFFDEDDYELVVGDWNTSDFLYEKIKQGNKKYKVTISNSNFSDIERLISGIVHILIQIELLEGKYINSDDEDMKGLIDLATTFFGFGIFLANGSTRTHRQDGATFGTYGVSRVGYLPDKVIAYTNAILCKISGKDFSKYTEWLNKDIRTYFIKSTEYISRTKSTKFNHDKLLEIEKLFKLHKCVETGFKNKDYEVVIGCGNELLELVPKKSDYKNNIGYAYLMLGDFNEALECFNNGLKLDPFWDVLFGNRAFCKIQIDELESAYTDIVKALKFDNENSYIWRTLGVYHLAKDEHDEALKHLLRALELDKETDLIHFYLAKVYEKVGDNKKQTFHSEKSAELNETNSGFLESYRY